MREREKIFEKRAIEIEKSKNKCISIADLIISYKQEGGLDITNYEKNIDLPSKFAFLRNVLPNMRKAYIEDKFSQELMYFSYDEVDDVDICFECDFSLDDYITLHVIKNSKILRSWTQFQIDLNTIHEVEKFIDSISVRTQETISINELKELMCELFHTMNEQLQNGDHKVLLSDFPNAVSYLVYSGLIKRVQYFEAMYYFLTIYNLGTNPMRTDEEVRKDWGFGILETRPELDLKRGKKIVVEQIAAIQTFKILTGGNIHSVDIDYLSRVKY